jgi:antitoxin (DNA-binding transcriptional repressor) of toxin-antitoxin stability system
VEAGERLTLTVNRRPVADLVPHTERRDPWVAAAELRRIVRDAPSAKLAAYLHAQSHLFWTGQEGVREPVHSGGGF